MKELVYNAITLAAFGGFITIIGGVLFAGLDWMPEWLKTDEDRRREEPPLFPITGDWSERWRRCQCGFLYDAETGRCESCGTRHG